MPQLSGSRCPRGRLVAHPWRLSLNPDPPVHGGASGTTVKGPGWHARRALAPLEALAGGEDAISFAAEIKSELAGLTPARPCCQLSELLGIFYSSKGRLIRSGDGQAAYFPLLRNTVARKVVRLARMIGGMEAKYQAVRSAKQMAFFIELPLP